VTETCGGTMSGYCASGIVQSVSMPAIVVTMAMTMASRGRSTKMAARHLRAGALRQQLLGPLQLHDGQDLRRLAALQGALRLLDRGLKQALLDAVERSTLLDEMPSLNRTSSR
jgi:hypothetical protein